jgi:hypothetical protein
MPEGRAGAGIDLLKSMHVVLLAFKSSRRPRKGSCMALKLIWRLVNTVSNEGPVVYRMVSSAKRWIKESLVARATSLMYTEKRVAPRIEPCGTPIETARGTPIETARGPDNRPSDLTY